MSGVFWTPWICGVNLRTACLSDLDALLEIEGSWPTTPHWSREQFSAELASQRARLFVIEAGGPALGYAGYWAVPPEAQIMNLAVSREHARRGLGRGLLKGLLDSARREGLTRATLEVSAANEAARRLYESEGFRVVGRRPKYYNDGSDALLMDKEL